MLQCGQRSDYFDFYGPFPRWTCETSYLACPVRSLVVLICVFSAASYCHFVYRHQTEVVFHFLPSASIIFIIWTTKVFKLVDCQTVSTVLFLLWIVVLRFVWLGDGKMKTDCFPQGWRDLWVDDAFWRLLFSTILLVIMVLLRPSANSQRSDSEPEPETIFVCSHCHSSHFAVFSQVFSFPSDWWWRRRGGGQGAHAERGFW